MRGRRVPRKYLFFPGWIMLVIAAAAQFMSAPGQSYSVAAFNRPMRDGLSITETDFSLAYGFATVLSGLSMPFVGRLLDRFGARLLLPVIGLLLGGACIGMSQTQSLGDLYLTFTMVRGLGQGALTLTAMWLVGEWFERRRGLATAMSGLGGTFSIMTFPLINRYLINTYDWQTAWAVLGIACWFVILVPSLLLVRNRPEDLGLQPDGVDADAEPDDEPANPLITPLEDSWTVAEVLRNVTFWKLLAVPATSGMVGTGLVFHQVSLLGSRGVAEGWALGLIAVQAGVGTGMSFVTGWLTDRVEARYLMSAAMVCLAAAIALLLVLPDPRLAVVYAVLLGLHGSVLRSTGMVVWINYYGRANQGGIRGVAFCVMILASALGPLPLAVSFDQTGSWTPALLGFLAIPLMSAPLVWTAWRPVRSV
jgi:MFS family permease